MTSGKPQFSTGDRVRLSFQPYGPIYRVMFFCAHSLRIWLEDETGEPLPGTLAWFQVRKVGEIEDSLIDERETGIVLRQYLAKSCIVKHRFGYKSHVELQFQEPEETDNFHSFLIKERNRK